MELRRTPRGFSMLELLAVVAIIIITMAIGIPVMLNVMNASRVRNEMSDISGVVQMCRSQAVQKNQNRELYFETKQGRQLAFVSTPNGPTGTPPTLQQTDRQVWLPAYFAKVDAPNATPTPLDSTIMWGDTLGKTPETSDNLCFNSRGIPCDCPSGASASTDYCAGITNGFAYYFTLDSQPGGTRWAAVGISPAGRIKTFFWDGYKWGD